MDQWKKELKERIFFPFSLLCSFFLLFPVTVYLETSNGNWRQLVETDGLRKLTTLNINNNIYQHNLQINEIYNALKQFKAWTSIKDHVLPVNKTN